MRKQEKFSKKNQINIANETLYIFSSLSSYIITADVSTSHQDRVVELNKL